MKEALSSKLRMTSLGVLAYFDNRNTTLLQTLDLTLCISSTLRRETYYELYSTSLEVLGGWQRSTLAMILKVHYNDGSFFPFVDNVLLLSMETLSMTYILLDTSSGFRLLRHSLLTISWAGYGSGFLNYSLGCFVEDLWAVELDCPQLQPSRWVIDTLHPYQRLKEQLKLVW
ncbi:hypothetical protein Tco_1316750 [Tanacetum coccineum]